MRLTFNELDLLNILYIWKGYYSIKWFLIA